ncbi:MAG: ABC transporter permease [Elusimicrobiales bacterium]|nr:ABC transporter permease [Elusimicrobiales bacterium]
MMIELRQIKKIYQMGGEPLEILKGIDLQIDEGEFVAIIGPSGSGKSTLMHILGLLDRPSSGSFKLFGKEISTLNDSQTAYIRAKIIGFVFQQFNLLTKMTAKENVELPQIYLGEEGDPKAAEHRLAQVDLSDRLDHKPNQISGGQQQRVSIARALVNNPKIIFADEPTGNLASHQSVEIMDIFRRMNREQGITVVLVTHDPDIAAQADRQIKIKDGMIVEDIRRAPKAEPVNKGSMTVPKSFKLTWREFKENLSSSVSSIISNKTRSLLTMLGIIIGVGALIAMLAVGNGAQKSIEKQMASMGTNLLGIMSNWRSKGVSTGRGSVSRITLDDLKIFRNIENITGVDGEVSGNAQVVYGNKNTNTSINGVQYDYARMRNSQPYYGRFFSEDEDNRLSKVCLLGQTVVNDLFGNENPVGKTVKINRKNFTVIGVLPKKGAQGPRDQDDVVVVPLNTAMRVLLGSRYLGSVWLEVSDYNLMSQVEKDVIAAYRKKHKTPAANDDPIMAMNMADMQAMMTSTVSTFGLLLGIIAGISLVVGGIGIMNIMLVSVSERTKEIGLRKAIGATKRAVLMQFLIEAVIVSILGGIIGILFGIGSSLLLAKIAKWSIAISPSSVFMAFGFSAMVGIIFGYLPARKASRLSPIEALRYE